MKEHIRKNTLYQRARSMRRAQTYAERIIWIELRKRRLAGFKFRRQHIIGPFIVDFVCLSEKVIFEVDGDSHELQKSYDDARTRYLKKLGYRVCRVMNEKVIGGGDNMLDELLSALEQKAPLPNPPQT
jgi:leucyl-tRNA synthetase